MAKLTHQIGHATPWSKPTTHRERNARARRHAGRRAAGAPRRVDANGLQRAADYRHGSQSRGHWTPMRLEAAPRPRQSQCSGSVLRFSALARSHGRRGRTKSMRGSLRCECSPRSVRTPAVESTSMRARAPAPALPLQGSVRAQHGIKRSGSRKCTCWSWALRPSRRRLRPGTASMAA